MPGSGPLLRPSALARFWELHPKTVVQWIRDGRLPAIRTPGAQWRVRPSDLVDFCARASLPIPPGARAKSARVAIVGGSAAAVRAVKRALHDAAAIDAYAEPIEGLLACARTPPAVLALDASTRAIDPLAAIRALRKADSALPIVAYGASSAARAQSLARAGATRALAKDQGAPALVAAIGELLAR